MADFRDKKIRQLFEGAGCLVNASAEDYALLISLATQRMHKALEQIKRMSEAQDIQLDPMPVKPPKAEE